VGGLDGDRPQRLRADRHTLYLTPAHAGARWRKDVPTEHINLYFDPQDGDAAAGVPASGAGVASGVPRLNVSLRGMSPVIDALEQELRAGDAFSPEAIDSWGRLLLIALARGPGAGASAQADPLRGATMRRLQDHVQAHLSQRLLIADLAALVDLPPQVFAAAFVRRTGRTPHQFVLAQRVIRARELLCGTGQPIAEVALACGFSSQSHLTRVLTERLGHSPQVLRQSQP
jgi:AraC family transcriptional regulator